ncbi:MAG: hypothetical protein Q8S18_09255 [Bacteroidales bacterium]|nr:hypothetical protein [Bacteroidales bacterium]
MKFSNKLNEFDILDLLNEYHSELRKLKYKTDYVKRKVAELEDHYNLLKSKSRYRSEMSTGESKSIVQSDDDATQKNEVEVVKPRRGRPAKPKREIITEKSKSRKPYPLSIWDNMILNSLKENGKAMLSKSIIEAVGVKAVEAGIFDNEEKLKSKINQCLVKLANKRSDVKKVNYKGKGFGYALPVWYDEKGKLRKEHGLK